MNTWKLSWTYDKANYQPGSNGIIRFNLENTGENYLYISRLGLQFDWQKNKYYSKECAIQIEPNFSRHILEFPFSIPINITSISTYRIGYHLWEYDYSTEKWNDFNEQWSEWKYYVKVIPMPYYRAFVSKGLISEEHLINDPIIEIIKEWGFITRTVEEPVNPEDLASIIKREIGNSECLILIATPRFKDALTGLFKIFEWGHGETGIAFGMDKPMLILKDERVDLGGLPSALKDYQNNLIPFDIVNIQDIRQKLGGIMPSFRGLIESIKRQKDQIAVAKQREEFWNTIVKIALGVGGGLLLGGITGYLIGRK